MRPEIALVIGGADTVLDEWQAALDLCLMYGQTPHTIVCNALIEDFPVAMNYAATLHPENLTDWLGRREMRGLPMPEIVWCNRDYNRVTNYMRDPLGSVGLFATKVMRHQDYTKIILCGVPMTSEGGHYKRKTDWLNGPAFWKRWVHQNGILSLRTCVRSMSGVTRAEYGAPDADWLKSVIDIPRPRHQPLYLKA